MNTLLFVSKYLSGDIPALIQEMKILTVPFVTVLMAMVVDFIFGVWAAKRRGDVRTSTGFRRSITKALEYYGLLVLALILDVIFSISDNVNLPYISFFTAFVLVCIEVYSVWENLQNKKIKSLNKNDLKILIALIENRGDILKSIIDTAKEKIKESDKTEIDNG